MGCTPLFREICDSITGNKYSEKTVAYMLDEVIKRLRQRLVIAGYQHIQLRVEDVAEKENKKYFARKTGVILHYLWIDISW